MNTARPFSPQPYEPVAKPDDVEGTISLRNVRDFFTRQWRLVAVVTALTMLLAAAYIAVSPKKYTAQADMIIDTKRVTWTQTEMASENRTVEDASVESEIETTKSERVALSVIKRLHLSEDPEFVGPGRGIIRRILAVFHLSPASEPVTSEE